jgi:membrane protein
MTVEQPIDEKPATTKVDSRPEPDESTLEEAPPRRRGRTRILVRAIRNANRNHITSLAAALAYYAFLAIPAALLLVLGLFGLFATPHDVTVVIERVGRVIPAQATNLLEGSLRRMTQRHSTGVTIVGVGGALAVWAIGGAMQHLMWALNIVHGRQESRGFIRRRLAGFAMAFFAALAFVLMFGVLVLGPALSHWVGNALGAETVVKIGWWVAEWPLLVLVLLVCFAALLYLGPDQERRRWRYQTFGALSAVAIWLAGSGAFAFFVSRFGSYNKTWGALSAVVITLIWLWLSAVALLLGAEIDVEADRGAPTLDGDEGVRRSRARGQRGLRRARELPESGSGAGRDGQRRADGDLPDHQPA